MEKIVLFNVGPETEKFIAGIAGNMRIKVINAAAGMYTETLERIVNNEAAEASSSDVLRDGLPSESLMLMCGLSEKHMDRLLAKLRQSSKRVDYKSVLTPTNAKWTLKRLMLEMEREKKALGG